MGGAKSPTQILTGQKENEAKAALENGPPQSVQNVANGHPKRMPTSFSKGQGQQVKDFSYVPSFSEKNLCIRWGKHKKFKGWSRFMFPGDHTPR